MRFFFAFETATLGKMPLQPPKRTPAGYFLAIQPATVAPTLRWTTKAEWELTEEWTTWAEAQRTALLGELISHGSWFSKPPRHEIMDPLFSPWVFKNMQGQRGFFCKTPDIPGAPGGSGTAAWHLQGLLLTSTAITPVWAVPEFKQDDASDTISLFGDADTVDGASEDGEGAEGTREIQLDDLEMAPAAEPLRVRTREWEARKFLAKERVREARLKAQIAVHLARKEESRFYSQFGELDDAESHFSEYDLTDTETESSDSGGDSVEDLGDA